MPNILTATLNTFLKADPAILGNDLPDSDKLRVRKGDVLEAQSVSKVDAYYVVRNATLNGQPVPDHLLYAHGKHWTLSEAPDIAAPVQSTPQPVSADPHRKPASPALSEQEQRARVLAMLAEGRSVSAIAKTLRIGRASIKRWRDGV